MVHTRIAVRSTRLTLILKILIPLFICILPYLPLTAENKILDWNLIYVEAKLKNNGNLQISETQSIRFAGDWNGAYRIFKMGLGQKIHFHSLEIQRKNGEWEALPNDSIDRKDSYLYYPRESMVKWRSRDPLDPSFLNETLVYRLNYEYENILNQLGDSEFELDHDFGFEDRNGEIREFIVNLSWEDEWNLNSELLMTPGSKISNSQLQFKATQILAPGQKMIVRSKWKYLGNPNSINLTSSWKEYAIRFFHLILLFTLSACLSYLVYRNCKKKGFFAEPSSLLNWNEFHTFLGDFCPEEIAILSENGLVASWLTRMILEKKIHFLSNENQEMELSLLADRSSLSDRDAKIIGGLFVNKKQTITTKELKEHYRKEKTSYSLHSDIEFQYSRSLSEKGILPNSESFPARILNFLFDRIIIKFYILIPLILIIFVGHIFFLDPILESNHISTGRFAFFCFAIFFARLFMSLLTDDHYGFYDLNHNRHRYFFYRFFISMIPTLLIFGFYFWSLDLTHELYLLLIALAGISIGEYLWNENPIQNIHQIRNTLNALAMKNFLEDKLIQDKPCDIPQEYASLIPAFNLNFSIEYRIEKLQKIDCLHLLPQFFEKWKDIEQEFLSQSPNSNFKSDSSTFSMGTQNTASSNSSSGISSGLATGLALGGLFGGAGASVSWSAMNEFSSSASYSPPSSSSSSGSSSSGGGGGGGW
jgi:hypothetical protein